MNHKFHLMLFAFINALLFQGCASHGPRMESCRNCGTRVCVVESSVVDEEKLAFEVESKDICVPPVMFPWQKCIPQRCGKVREVCVLKETTTDVKVCEYEWSVKAICPDCKRLCK